MPYRLLENITSPADLKKLPLESLPNLSEELRDYLINTILMSGGHFAANLGVVELTIALHYVFDAPNDAFVWDVGHQSYPHKILTGRREMLSQIRHLHGISGFPSRFESDYDAFGAGHSSTAISAASGIASAFRLQKKTQHAIAIVGDAALSAGLSFEALNNVHHASGKLLIVLNDNHIGIDPNTGAVDEHLQNIEKYKTNLFQNLNIPYFGPIDGHHIGEMVDLFKQIQLMDSPAIVHCKTIKGKGFTPAEQEQTKWHSTNKYVKINPESTGKKWQDYFGEHLEKLMDTHPEIICITPAMPTGSGLVNLFQKYPDRCFDVGIAEQHAVTFAAGLATQGFVPFVVVYSSFLQRAYDQIIHDVALQKLPVVFCIDRGGLVGEDGATHHGNFDIAFLRCVPEITLTAAANPNELHSLMELSVLHKKPFAIRYPKGEFKAKDNLGRKENLIYGNGLLKQSGKHILLLTYGPFSEEILIQLNTNGINITWFNVLFLKPLNHRQLMPLMEQHQVIITHEEGAIIGGLASAIDSLIATEQLQKEIVHWAYPDEFIEHGPNAELKSILGLSDEKLISTIRTIWSKLV